MPARHAMVDELRRRFADIEVDPSRDLALAHELRVIADWLRRRARRQASAPRLIALPQCQPPDQG